MLPKFSRSGPLFLFAGCAIATAFSIGACSASGDDAFSDGDNDDGGGTGGTGGEGGIVFDPTGGNGGNTVVCNGAECVGDTPQGGCDAALTLTGDAMQAAQAIGLCQVSDGNSWGVVSAEYVKSDGTPLGGGALADGTGILTAFGGNVTPQEGATMLALSSGPHVRQPIRASKRQSTARACLAATRKIHSTSTALQRAIPKSLHRVRERKQALPMIRPPLS